MKKKKKYINIDFGLILNSLCVCLCLTILPRLFSFLLMALAGVHNSKRGLELEISKDNNNNNQKKNEKNK